MRPGEALDVERLAAYLAATVPELAGVATITVEQFPSGHSNLTYLLHVSFRTEGGFDRQQAAPQPLPVLDLVLRRPPVGAKIKTAHDMGREFHILSRLAPVYPKAPRPLAYCPDESVLGAPFYVMERLTGVILRNQAPAGIGLTAGVMRGLSEAFVDTLVDLHRSDYAAIGLGDLGSPAGYVRRQIDGWTQRYCNAATDDLPHVERAAAWLAGHLPAESGATLIHNDFKYDNLVLDPADLTRIVGVLDWEMATIGDPLMDLGTSLGYWIDPNDAPELLAMSLGLTTLPGNFSRRELTQRYAERTGLDPGDGVFYYVYGLFKIAVIAQQIYARYKAGLTQDRRFATLIHGVAALGEQASRAIARGRIDDLLGP